MKFRNLYNWSFIIQEYNLCLVFLLCKICPMMKTNIWDNGPDCDGQIWGIHVTLSISKFGVKRGGGGLVVKIHNKFKCMYALSFWNPVLEPVYDGDYESWGQINVFLFPIAINYLILWPTNRLYMYMYLLDEGIELI